MERSGIEAFRIDGSGLKIPDNLIHMGDTDTQISFATDTIALKTGGTAALTLDSSQNATFAGELIVPDDININTDNKKLNIGASADLKLYHDGNHSYIKDTGTGNLRIDGTDNVELQAGGSTKAYTYANGLFIYDAQIPDDGELNIGNNSDLKIKHVNAENANYITSANNVLYICGKTGQTAVQITPDGATDLRYSGVQKIKTTSTGVEIDGRIDGKSGNHLDLRTLSSHSIQLRTNNTLRLNLTHDGHLVPYHDSTYDLGTNGTRFRNLYADTVYGDGSNLTNLPAAVPSYAGLLKYF